MGNVATRKRAAAKAEEPARKRMRFSRDPEYEEICASSRLRHLHRRMTRRGDDRRKGVVELQFAPLTLNEHAQTPLDTDVPHSPKKDFPLPWFELLFLPEFPIRSIISEKSFALERQLGRGSFGTVYCASALHDEKRKFAIKVQKKNEIISRHAVLQVRREANVQRLLPAHPFVARIYSTWQTRTKLFSVLQYPMGSIGDLFSVWRERGSFSEASIRLIGAELASAIDFLHGQDVIYRDVKLENIVLDACGHVLLIDFGLAKKLRNGDFTSTICGTLQYMSPDVASGKPYSHYIDWWSLAVLLHVLFTGIYPYPNAEASHHSHLTFVDYSTPIGCSLPFGNLMDRMLAVSLQHRLCSFTVLHAHPFFGPVSFNKIENKEYNPIDGMQENSYDEAHQYEPEEDVRPFDEHYEFDRFDYFNDKY